MTEKELRANVKLWRKRENYHYSKGDESRLSAMRYAEALIEELNLSVPAGANIFEQEEYRMYCIETLCEDSNDTPKSFEEWKANQ